MSTQQEKIRLDKWLWAARFFKTRALATEAINGGKVHLNTQRVKPARAIKIGDTITIRKGPYKYIVEVMALSARRGPATAAAKLYAETEQSQLARSQLAEQLRAQIAFLPLRDKGRPTKKSRRQIISFTIGR